MRLIYNNKNFIQDTSVVCQHLFTFNSISTRYSVIMLAIISKLPAPILTSSLNDICSFYRIARDARGVHLLESAITSKHRAGVLSSFCGVTFMLLVSCSMPLRSSIQQCTGRILHLALRCPLFLGIKSGLQFIRCIINYQAHICSCKI